MSLKILRNQQGFTIIELVMVIVIIGILAAVAVPKFVDLKASANTSVLKGVQGSINGAIVMLHSQYIINGSGSAYNTASVVAQVQAQGVTLAAALGVLTATLDSGCTGSWVYNPSTGSATMATIGSLGTANCT